MRSLRVFTFVALALLAGCRSASRPILESDPDRATLLLVDAHLERLDRRGRPVAVPNDRAVLLDRDGERHYVEARGGLLASDSLAPGSYALLILRGRTGLDEESREEWVYLLPRDAEEAVRLELETGRPTYLGLGVRRVGAPEEVEMTPLQSPRTERDAWSRLLEHHPTTPWATVVRERVEALEARMPTEEPRP